MFREEELSETCRRPDPARKLSANFYDINPLLCVQRKIPDDGQRDFSKHVVFYSKNKFEKLVHLFGFVIRKYGIILYFLACTVFYILDLMIVS